MSKIRRLQKQANQFIKRLGPGIVTGAADDDPSGIGTYSQTGAQYGFKFNWSMFFMLPLMTAVQEMAGRIGLVTGKGLARLLKDHYSQWILYSMVFFLVLANVVNIGADIGAMAASAQLLVPLPYIFWTVFFTIAIAFLQIMIPYKQYAKILKWLCLSLLAYVITAMIVGMPWGEVLRNSLVPQFKFTPEYILIFVALLGTTISPYLFFWEPSQEVEEEIEHHWLKKSGGEPIVTDLRLRRFRQDNVVGMVLSQTVSFFIMIVAAATLHKHGITDITSADQAARALEPLAGTFAKVIFSVGVIGTGLLAIPVLAGSTAYAMSESLGIREGLYQKVRRAPGFYTIIAGVTVSGLLINFVGIDPIKALVYAAVVNGVMAVPLIFMIIRISNNPDIMGDYKSSRLSNFFGIIALLVMALASAGMIFIH